MNKIYNILIAEDEENIALALQSIVAKNFNANIDMVYDGISAWGKIQSHDYDLIISDWNMPAKTGDELLADVRMRHSTKNLPFLMLTARTDKDSVITAIQAGVTKYITKPFQKKSLVDKISELLNCNDHKEIHSGVSTKTENRKNGSPRSTPNSRSTPLIDEIIMRLKSDSITYPILPEVGFKIVETMSKDNLDANAISKIISSDTSLTSRIIQLSNSSIYRRNRDYLTLEDAINRIGIVNTQNFILALTNRNLFNVESKTMESILESLREHAIATALSARAIATLLKYNNPQVLFTMGLLHDIGKLFLAVVLLELAKDKGEIEKDVILSTMEHLHTKFGVALLQKWKLPSEIIDIAKNHHHLRGVTNPSDELLIIIAANILVREMGKSLKEPTNDPDFEIVKDKLGLNEADLTQVTKDTEIQLKDISEML